MPVYEKSTPVPRWGLHARDYRMALGDVVWCSRCGAIHRGEMKGRYKVWVSPMVSQHVALPSSFR